MEVDVLVVLNILVKVDVKVLQAVGETTKVLVPYFEVNKKIFSLFPFASTRLLGSSNCTDGVLEIGCFFFDITVLVICTVHVDLVGKISQIFPNLLG